MTEQQYADFILEQRRLARELLQHRLWDLRIALWPRLGTDPIHAEDVMRERRAALTLRAMPVINPPSILKVVNPA